MIKIKAVKPVIISFNLRLEGVESRALVFVLRFYNEIIPLEYGFRGQVIENDIVQVKLPSLSNAFNIATKEDEVFPIWLDVIGEGRHWRPWEDQLVVEAGPIIHTTVEQVIEAKDPEVPEAQHINITAKQLEQKKVEELVLTPTVVRKEETFTRISNLVKNYNKKKKKLLSENKSPSSHNNNTAQQAPSKRFFNNKTIAGNFLNTFNE